MNVYHFLERNNIKTSYISKNLTEKKNFEMIRYKYNDMVRKDGIILIGLFNKIELKKLKKYRKKVIYWNRNNLRLLKNLGNNLLLLKNVINVSEDINTYNFLINNNINSITFDKFFISFDKNIQIKTFDNDKSINTYYDLEKEVIFVSPKTLKDIIIINNHRSNKYLLWDDNSNLNLLFKISNYNLFHITNSNLIYTKLYNYKLNPIFDNFSILKKPSQKLFDKALYTNLSINLIKVKESNYELKGINIDIDIINYYFNKISVDANVTLIEKSCLKSSKIESIISLTNDIYIFSEYLLFRLFSYLLGNRKVVIFIPNIDAHQDKDFNNWDESLLNLMKYRNFFIWSKTKQTYEWIDKYQNRCDTKNNNNILINFNHKYVKSKTNIRYLNKILIDTGSSDSDRKYITQMLELFANNIFTHTLVVKTVPNIYLKYNFKKYESCRNILIINKIFSEVEMDDLYNKYIYLIYMSKYDGFGLTLSKAINNKMFIFTCDQKPWNEILDKYPRKCYIDSILNENNNIYNSQKLNVPDFYDLKKKLINFSGYENIINNTYNECENFNINKFNLFSESIFNFLLNKVNIKNSIQKKNLLVDCQPLQHEVAGLYRYGINFLNQIIKQGHFNVGLLINNFLNKSFIKDIINNYTLHVASFNLKKDINHHDRYNSDKNERSHEIKLANFVRNINPDIFLNLSEVDKRKISFRRNLLKNCNISTFSVHHDIIPIKMNKKEKNSKHYNEKLNNIKEYDYVLTNSNFTKSDSSYLFKNIHCISTGFTSINVEYNTKYKKQILKKFSLENKKYIFYQSRFDIYKGFDKLCAYYSELPKGILNEIYLVLGTSKNSYNLFIDILAKNKIDKNKLRVTGYLKDSELTTLHENSWLFVHNSDYEGFGMSLLDAWFYKKPAIVNNSSSLKEIMNNKDFCYNNKESFVKLVETLYQDADIYKKCINHGATRLNLYTWEKVYKRFYEIIYKDDKKKLKLNEFSPIKISFILCVKNNEIWLKYFEKKIKIIEKNRKFLLEFFIYENNSSDNTKNILIEFIKNRNGKVYFDDIDKNLNYKGVSFKRGNFMSKIRENLKKKHGILKSDYVIIIDSNITFSNDIIDKFLNEYEVNKYAMVTPFTECKTHKYHYYDSLAFISKNNISMKDTGNTCLFKDCTRCFDYRKRKGIKLDSKYLLSSNKINEIAAGFGCCAFLKTSIYNKCSWVNENNEVYCEHITFCENVREFGKIIVTNKIKLYNLCENFTSKELEYYDNLSI